MMALALSVQVLFAQHPISNALTRLLNTGDFRDAQEAISNYSISELAALPDSTLFDYHYLGGYLNSEIHNHEKAIYHLTEAKRLCDKSLGTHSIGYMEIMRGLGDEYIELNQ